MMSFVNINATEFVRVLASSDAVPGGGGASALVGAIGVALGNMVGSLTVGKKKYADVEAEIIELKKKSDELQAELLRLVDEDAIAFEPLSKAYGIPKDDPNRAKIMEDALRVATATPLEIMRACGRAIDIIAEFAEKGSTIALSDAGVGVVFCKAALQGASLNVLINARAMTDRDYVSKIEKELNALRAEYVVKADEIYSSVATRIWSGGA